VVGSLATRSRICDLQAHRHSIAEAIANVAAGYGIAVMLTWLLYGIGWAQSVRGSVWYVLASLVRSYMIRRAFAKVTERARA
jgi:hypothetical protein